MQISATHGGIEKKSAHLKHVWSNGFHSARPTLARLLHSQSPNSLPQPPSTFLATAEKALKEQDYDMAFKFFKPLAEQGNSEVQANLGLMYELGRGVDKDFVEAFK
ncbi:MAG: hypothetical protein MZV65_11685 [Chromatiales bacterium]|nr:hypothetical protein [Chromatiales bacterium]